MPGTAEHFQRSGDAVITRLGRIHQAHQHTATKRRTLVRTAVQQREILTVGIEDADPASAHFNELAVAGGDLTHFCNYVAAHFSSRRNRATALSRKMARRSSLESSTLNARLGSSK